MFLIFQIERKIVTTTNLARRLDEKLCSTELDSAFLPNEQPSTQKSFAVEAKPMSNRSPQGLAFQSDSNQPQRKRASNQDGT